MKKTDKQRIKKRLIVTGGAGFIGSHLVDALIDLGHQVVVIDNLSTGREENLNPAASFFKVDIRNSKKLEGLFKGVEAVFHLAALPRVQLSIDNPEETHDANVNGTLNILIAAKEAKVKKIIYSASSSAYGHQKTLPLHEKMAPNPLSPYAVHKYIGEKYCNLFSRFYGLDSVCLRYFNVYGPRQNDEGPYATAIAKFIKLKREDKPLTIFGNGKQTRDFTHVSDVVRANILALRSKVGRAEVINIGAGESHSINRIANLIGGKKKHLKPREGEAKHTKADIKKAKRLLGWRSQVSLEKGVKDLLNKI